MSNEYELNPAEQELERALCGLKPASLRLERDRLMFRAGQASVERRQVMWPAISGALGVMLAASWMIPWQPANRHVPATAQKTAPALLETTAYRNPRNLFWIVRGGELAGTANSYCQLRDRVLRRGLDGLPQDPAGSESQEVENWSPFRAAQADDFEMKL